MSETARILSRLPDGHGRLTCDSRAVRAGDVFCAFRGTQSDGRTYIDDAIKAGASAIIVDQDEGTPPACPVPVIAVQSLRRRYSFLVEASADRPSSALRLVGVTGTNGKSSVALWIAQALESLGEPCGVIGTLGAGRVNDLKDVANTTPDAAVVATALTRMLRAGCKAAAMEVSSHALDQNRVDALAFQYAVFTNLTRDHLDYHGTMEAYAQAKARLFAFATVRTAIVNADDPAGDRMARATFGDVLRYSANGNSRDAHIYATDVSLTRRGINLVAKTPRGEVNAKVAVLGGFNVANLLAVTGVLCAMGYDVRAISKALSELSCVPGRMQRVNSSDDSNPLVVVDYAHTPDALEKAISTLRGLMNGVGILHVVFGCGGRRDAGKRPIMGAIAAQLADHVWVTSDNPRSESPRAIVDQIMAGIGAEKRSKTTVMIDRAQAIAAAINKAQSGDVVLIAGKGHETYQEIEGVKLPFDDVAHAKKALIC